MASKLNQPVSDKAVAIIVAIIASAALAIWAAWAWHKRAIAGQPASPLEVKSSIWKFIAKQSGQTDFQVPAEILSNSPARTIQILTNAAGGVRTTRNVRIRPAESSASIYFRTNQEQAATYRDIYRFVGQQLALADQFFTNQEIARRSLGLQMAAEASAYTRTNAMNPWLSARICEAYLWPNLSLADPTNRPSITADSLLNLCDVTFKQAGETNNVLRNYEYMVTRTGRPSESTRYRLARLYQDAGEDAKALEQLRLIKTYKIKQVEFEIGVLEKRLNATKH